MTKTEKTGANRLTGVASAALLATLLAVPALRAASSGRALSPAAQTAWGSVEGGLDKVGQAFGLPARLP